ncbi:MAG: hypothetical protein ACREBH_03405 [Candidatus Micrarchaeaceae archaeon]
MEDALQSQPNSTQSPQKKGLPKKLILSAAIIVIIVIVVLIAVYAAIGYNAPKKPKATTMTTTILGINSSGPLSSVYTSSTTVQSTTTSTVSSANETNTTSANETNSTNLIQSNYIYCVGTQATYPYNYTYYAPINASGIGNWTATTSYPIPIYMAGCSISGNYIYCVGSSGIGNTSSSMYSYYALVNDSGIGSWTMTTSYPAIFNNAGCSIGGNYIYCVGGVGHINSFLAYYAPISGLGIGNWTKTTPYPERLYGAGCSIYDDYIYCVGTGYANSTTNFNATTLESVYYAPVSDSGIGNWTATTSYPIPFYGAGCSIYDDYIYCVGNNYYGQKSSAYYAHVTASGIGAWQQTTSYPLAFSNDGCVASEGYLYCVGATSSNQANMAYYAPISANGIGTWNATTSYPVQLSEAYCSTTGESGGFLSG